MRRVLMMGWLLLVPVATQAQVPDDRGVEEERVAGAAAAWSDTSTMRS